MRAAQWTSFSRACSHERSTAALADARERRRVAARRLIELGRGTSWIAQQLGVLRRLSTDF